MATYYGFIDTGRIVKEMSAEELNAALKKGIRVEVTDTQALSRVLDEMKIEYKILSEKEADIYAKINVSKLTLALAKENCEVISMQEHTDNLESYFISLIGGGKHE